MIRIPATIALCLLTQVAVAEDGMSAFPEPLPTPEFNLPEASVHTLSNGLEVRIVENHEVPLWNAQLVVRGGSGQDPMGKEGLASVTLDLMDDGTTTRTASEISRNIKRLGSSLSSGAGLDSATVSASGILRNIEPTLDILVDVALNPTFPADEWQIVQDKRVADATAKLEDPDTVGREVFYKTLYGGLYQGSISTADSFRAISTDDMEAWHASHFQPGNALLLVGGDVTPEQVLPMLEARFGTWQATGEAEMAMAPEPAVPESSVLYFVDKPGAAQSVIRLGGFVGQRTEDDYYALHIGNAAFGGAFTARVNMNLREDKGYTYGARCRAWYPEGPGVFFCSTSVRTDATGASLTELRRELTEVLDGRPISDDEVAYYVSSEVNGYPGQYETVGAVLGEHADIWLHGLPDDWQSRYLPGVQAVDATTANAALASRVSPDRLIWTVVGDREQVYDDLESFGLPIIELDRMGNPVEGSE